MPRPKTTHPTLVEMEILAVVERNNNSMSVAEILEQLRKRRKVAYSSVATIVRIMVGKDLLHLDQVKRPQKFSAKITTKVGYLRMVEAYQPYVLDVEKTKPKTP